MPRFVRKRAPRKKAPGTAPGTLLHVGERKAERVHITVIDYDGDRLEEREAATVDECLPFRDAPTVTWLNVDGLHDVEVIERLGRGFGIHPLVLEDLLSTSQRPKLEEYDSYLFLVIRVLTYAQTYGQQPPRIEEEQLGLVLGEGFVLSFQERPGDVFDAVRERIRAGKGRLRQRGADYLAYALVDAVVDHYFVVLEGLGEHIDDVEAELLERPDPGTVTEIHRLKHELLFLRRSVWPLREVLSALHRNESALVSSETMLYLRDVYDHTIQVIDTAETFRDMVAGMLDTYLSSLSNRMNEVMKVLTIIATIFIPLTFIAGVYGMNFDVMPELRWAWGYPAVLALMAVTAGGLVLYFRRRGWL